MPKPFIPYAQLQEMYIQETWHTKRLMNELRLLSLKHKKLEKKKDELIAELLREATKRGY